MFFQRLFPQSHYSPVHDASTVLLLAEVIYNTNNTPIIYENDPRT
jgi:hypothetical protein